MKNEPPRALVTAIRKRYSVCKKWLATQGERHAAGSYKKANKKLQQQAEANKKGATAEDVQRTAKGLQKRLIARWQWGDYTYLNGGSCFGGCGNNLSFDLAEILHLRPQADLTEANGFCPEVSSLEPLSAVLGCSNCNQWNARAHTRSSSATGNQWTWQRYEFDWEAAGITWEAPILPDGTEWDPEHEDSRHYLNGFVGKGEACEYLNPGTTEWARKNIALQLRQHRTAN